MVLSACMMLDYLDEDDKAERIRSAIAAVISEGEIRTYDMMRIPGGRDVIERGAASTQQMTEAIIAKL